MWTKGRKNGSVTFLISYSYMVARFFFNSQIVKRLLYLALSVEMDLGKSVKLLAVRILWSFLFVCMFLLLLLGFCCF